MPLRISLQQGNCTAKAASKIRIGIPDLKIGRIKVAFSASEVGRCEQGPGTTLASVVRAHRLLYSSARSPPPTPLS